MEDFSIAYVHNGTVRNEFCEMLIKTLCSHTQSLINIIAQSGPYIALNRNKCVEHFLASYSGNWLFFLDNDIRCPPDTIDLLIDKANEYDAKILGALYFSTANGDVKNRWWPIWRHQWHVIPEVTLTETYDLTSEGSAVGMGCTIIHKEVLEALYEKDPTPFAWFGNDRCVLPDGEPVELGEDFTFCRRAMSLGYQIHAFAHPVEHYKVHPVDHNTFHAQNFTPLLDEALWEPVPLRPASPPLPHLTRSGLLIPRVGAN